MYATQWGIFWSSLHSNVDVFTLHSHLRCSWEKNKKKHLNQMCLCWTYLFSIIYCSNSDIHHSHWSPQPLLHLRTSSNNPLCYPLFTPPFPSPSLTLSLSLCPFLFLLITSALIYDRTQENSFQVLICISPTLSPASFPPLPPHLCSGLCSAALRPYQNRNTPRFLSLHSL